MTRYYIQKEIPVITVMANAFPQGVMKAFTTLQEKVQPLGGVSLYGISKPGKNGEIIYEAAASCNEIHSIATDATFQKKTIPATVYMCEQVKDFSPQNSNLYNVFQLLLQHPQLDPNGFCLELYAGSDVLCMVPLKSRIGIQDNLVPELTTTFTRLINTAGQFNEENIHAHSDEQSWSAAQVMEHLTKSYGIADALKQKTIYTERDPLEKVDMIRSTFLNYEKKFSSPSFILPGHERSSREKILSSAQLCINNVLEYCNNYDISETCTGIEFPGGDLLTGIEWMYMMLYHTQRHIRQLNNILSTL